MNYCWKKCRWPQIALLQYKKVISNRHQEENELTNSSVKFSWLQLHFLAMTGCFAILKTAGITGHVLASTFSIC